MERALHANAFAPNPDERTPNLSRFSPPSPGSGPAKPPTQAQLMGEELLRLAVDFGMQGAYYVHLGHAVRDRRLSVGREAVRFVATSVSDRRLYLDEGGLACDPAAVGVAYTHLPLVWAVSPEKEADETRRLLLQRLRGRGVTGGVSVPIQDYSAGPAYLSLYSAFRGDPDRLLRQRAPDLVYCAIRFHEAAKAHLPARQGDASSLTGREIECLRLAALGLTVTDTAEVLCVTARTVEFHLKNAAEKFGAPNKLRAVALAIGLGLIAT